MACVPILSLLALLSLVPLVAGHGRMLQPPNRASLWRFGFPSPPNYDDNGLNCGGFSNQWYNNGGRCGFCGDPFQGSRDHEEGGKFANNLIAGKYEMGGIMDVTVDITANHGGYFEFRLCPSRHVTQECLDRHVLHVLGHGPRFTLLDIGSQKVKLQLKLPSDVTCEQCVLQWKWNSGQSYGQASTGEYCKGCGMQEQFYNCADIKITDPTQPQTALTSPPATTTTTAEPEAPRRQGVVELWDARHSGRDSPAYSSPNGVSGPRERPPLSAYSILDHASHWRREGRLDASSGMPSRFAGSRADGWSKQESGWRIQKSSGWGSRGEENKGVEGRHMGLVDYTPEVAAALKLLPELAVYVKPREPVCQGVEPYGKMLDDWCRTNCKLNFCPPTHCRCS